MFKMSAFQKGLICLALFLVLLPGCGGMKLIQAEMKLSQKQYAEAIPICQEYLAENPNSVLAHNKLGFAYLKTGQLNNAVKEFETALKYEPNNCYAILYLGLAYLNQKDFRKAIDMWQTFRDKDKPLVEAEIKRLLTVLQIADSQRLSKQALEQEEQLKAKKPDFDTVAVCYYKDLSPNKSLQAFQKGLAAMLITDMSKVKSFRIVERLRIQALLQEMKLGQTGIVDERTAPRVGHLLGAENMITGNLAIGSIRSATSLVSTSTGNVTGTSVVEIEKDQFYELPKRIIEDYARIMGIELTSEEKQAIGIPHTKNYQAFIYYGEGLNALDEGRWQDAKDLFGKALELDPLFDIASESAASTPTPSTPDVGSISGMSDSELIEYVDMVISKAEEDQKAADKAAEAATQVDSGY